MARRLENIWDVCSVGARTALASGWWGGGCPLVARRLEHARHWHQVGVGRRLSIGGKEVRARTALAPGWWGKEVVRRC